jgi:plasmid stability protein
LTAGNFTFRLRPSLRVELQQRARVHGWSVSDEVRYVLELSLDVPLTVVPKNKYEDCGMRLMIDHWKQDLGLE